MEMVDKMAGMLLYNPNSPQAPQARPALLPTNAKCGSTEHKDGSCGQIECCRKEFYWFTACMSLPPPPPSPHTSPIQL